MNKAIIRLVLGHVIRFEGIFMLFPALIALIYGETEGVYFAACAVASLLLGTLLTRKKPKSNSFFAKEGFVTVSLSWIVLSIIGCLPFLFSGVIPNPVDAMFEIVSGFTTTGASILSDVESLPKCMLFWRSFSHWIGGKSGTKVWKTCAKAAKQRYGALWYLPWHDSYRNGFAAFWRSAAF
jgi:trk system potassium uptake protein TrkH